MSTVSVEVIAKLLNGKTTRRVQQLAKEGIIPKASRGQYEIAPCVIGYIKFLESRLDGDAGDLLTEKTRLTRLQSEKLETEIARLKGEMVSIAAAEYGWSALIGAFRAKMLTIPSRAALSLVKKTEKEIEQILTDMIYEALAELSNWKPEEDDDESGADDGATPGGDGRGSTAANADQSVGG
ncbi:MAG: hypothetical protein LBF93_03570 [Zoogloeaceae bacterium]|jgi:phage terminase Nu1 subunit (DNA packaging protein)|nr:hypothetical protein [Zoogloeaceae bacterium]